MFISVKIRLQCNWFIQVLHMGLFQPGLEKTKYADGSPQIHM